MLPPSAIVHARPSTCTTLNHLFEGSEDITLWRAGLAFVSSGLVPSPTQRGRILLANLSGSTPTIAPVAIEAGNTGRNFSAFGFRPHGLHLDNSSSRLYAVSHSDLLHEEAVFVFDVQAAAETPDVMPSLRFRYALTSPHFQYHNRSLLWFLNDVAAVDGSDELYVTQLGPLDFSPATFKRDKALWRCTWDEASIGADGRLAASCASALPSLFLGLNGVTINPSASTLFVNDEFGGVGGSSRLLPFARDRTTGVLKAGAPIALNGSSIDNVERDCASGDLLMGQYHNQHGGSQDAGLRIRSVDGHGYAPARVMSRAAIPKATKFQVSSALTYGQWTLLGSPWDLGPYACRA